MLKRLVYLSLLIAASVVSLDAADAHPSMVTLFGRMHVLLIHFPVALIMVLAGIETLRWRKREGSVDSTVAIIAVIAALSSVVAVAQGWMLAGDNPGESDYAQTIELHRWLGVSTAVVAVIVAIIALARQFGDSRKLSTIYRVFVFPGAILVSLTGHYGGVAMHGPGFLPIMPWEMFASPAAEKPTDPIPDTVSFWRDIDPIFVKNCYECHDAKEKKGELRMDSRELLLKGGDGGTSIISGKGKESLLVIRLFEGEDDPRMPKKKPALSATQIALITKWIDQGAEWPAKPAATP